MNKLLFIGGDNRSITAINELKKIGYKISSFGLFKDDYKVDALFDAVILPVPTTKDKKTVFCPLTNREILLSDVKSLAKGKPIISCGYSFEDENNVNLSSLDSYAYLNAVPTAEGAIAFAIDNTDYTLWGSKVLVIGNGRVAKILISRLSSFGCKITVSARSDMDFAILETQNLKYITTSSVPNAAKDFDIIFNTIDVELFKNPTIIKDSLLIDLSSKGCIDFKKAQNENISAYKLSGLPGKVAPVTSGKILAKTVNEQIKNFQCNNGKER